MGVALTCERYVTPLPLVALAALPLLASRAWGGRLEIVARPQSGVWIMFGTLNVSRITIFSLNLGVPFGITTRSS